MEMRKHIQDIYKTLSTDEILLRLLFYQPSNALDHPLDLVKENILDKDDKWDIIDDRIKTSPKVDDLLDDTPKCRLLFFAGRRNPTKNYLFSNQDIRFDIFVHFDFDTVDQRLSWICDHLNSIMFDSRITGFGSIEFSYGDSLPAPKGYVGYRLVFTFGSENYK